MEGLIFGLVDMRVHLEVHGLLDISRINLGQKYLGIHVRFDDTLLLGLQKLTEICFVGFWFFDLECPREVLEVFLIHVLLHNKELYEFLELFGA